jgi:hypothetical protein
MYGAVGGIVVSNLTAMVTLTMVLVSSDMAVLREGTTKVLDCARKVCGSTPEPDTVKEVREVSVIEKGKKVVVPKTLVPIEDSGVSVKDALSEGQ